MRYAFIGILWMFLVSSASHADALTTDGFADTCSDISVFKIDRSLNLHTMGQYLYSYITKSGKEVAVSEDIFNDFTEICEGIDIKRGY